MATRSLMCILILALTLHLTAAWWDEAHMLVAAVAQLQLDPFEVAAIEEQLEAWENDYPGLATIATSAVWPDQIKCRYPSARVCRRVPHMDSLEIFSDWHYISMIHNPTNIKLEGIQRFFPLPHTGAVWALSQLMLVSDSTTHLPSPVSWNIRLRFLIHIMGDIHQPLHTAETFSKAFPDGDMGGNHVAVDLSKTKLSQLKDQIENLHSLWDSCGGLFTRKWPDITQKDILQKAKLLQASFPRSFFGSAVKSTSFWSIAHESHAIAADKVFKEINWSSVDKVYEPSDDYIHEVQDICQRQIVLGGYRLAHLLKYHASILLQSFSSRPLEMAAQANISKLYIQ